MLLHELKKFNFKNVSRSLHRILLVIWKCSAWAFYRWAMAWVLNGNAAAYCLSLKKCLAFKHKSSLTDRCKCWILYYMRPQVVHLNKIQRRFRIYQRFAIMTGPKVLGHSGISISLFSLLPIFNIDSYCVLTRTPLLSVTLRWDEKGEFCFDTRVWDTIPSHFIALNGWLKLKKERRFNNFWPW